MTTFHLPDPATGAMLAVSVQPTDECAIHAGRPDECPRQHVCECGRRLSDHIGTGAACAKGSGDVFRPDPTTMARFPEQYAACLNAPEVRP